MARRGSQPLQPINAVGSRSDTILLLREITIPHEGAYDPNTYLSFSDVAVNSVHHLPINKAE